MMLSLLLTFLCRLPVWPFTTCYHWIKQEQRFQWQAAVIGRTFTSYNNTEVAIAYKDKDLNQIGASSVICMKVFVAFFKQRYSLTYNKQKTLGDDMALKVLKTLFMIKYVKGFPSTTDNITKIMLPTLDTLIFPEYKSRIQEAFKQAGSHLLHRKRVLMMNTIIRPMKKRYWEQRLRMRTYSQTLSTMNWRKFSVMKFSLTQKIKLSNNKVFSYGRFGRWATRWSDSEMYIHFVTPVNSFVKHRPTSNAHVFYGTSNTIMCSIGWRQIYGRGYCYVQESR